MNLTFSLEPLAVSTERATPTDEREEMRRLVLRLQDGDRAALTPLIEKTQASAYRIGYSVAQDHHLCQDAVQDAYISLLQNIKQLRDPSAFVSWFTRIVVNRCKRLLKQRRPASLTEVVEQGKGPRPMGSRRRPAGGSNSRKPCCDLPTPTALSWPCAKSRATAMRRSPPSSTSLWARSSRE